MEWFNPREEVDKTLHKLPHWQQGRVSIFCTFRLADSLPGQVLAPLLAVRDGFLERYSKLWDESVEREFHRQFTMEVLGQLDAGHGGCALRDVRVAGVVEYCLRHSDAKRYELHAYVVMPNHVHVLFTPYVAEELPVIVKLWKGVSSRMIHQAGLSELRPFWQPDYFDRLIRSPEHFDKVLQYVVQNPAKARLKTGFVVWQQG